MRSVEIYITHDKYTIYNNNKKERYVSIVHFRRAINSNVRAEKMHGCINEFMGIKIA